MREPGDGMSDGCATCKRWVRYKAIGSRYGRCAVPKSGPKPYWHGQITTYQQLDTADIHGVGYPARKAA